MECSLLNSLRALSNRMNEEMNELYQTVLGLLSPHQVVTLIQFMKSQKLENTDFYVVLSRIEATLPAQTRSMTSKFF